MKCWLWCSSLVLISWAALVSGQKNVICYFSSWATYRPGNGKFDVETIDPFLCTHVIYAFVGLNWDATVRVMDSWNDIEQQAFSRFNNLRNKNSNLKTLIAIGGWNEGSVVFSEICRDSATRAKFVTSAYNFVVQHGFSGLDIDWEYPAQRGGGNTDRANFVSLLRELSVKFKPAGLLLTIAVSASVYSVPVSYNIPEIVKYVDFVNLMTYDYHGSWESRTGSNSPLYPSSVDTDLTINGDATVRYWLDQGAPSYKLMLGAPMFGRTWTLQSPTSPGLGATAVGPGAVGPYTQESGFMGYNEICEALKSGGWSVNWATQQKVPFAFKANQWVGYDNVQSVRIKAEYAKMKALGGMLVWGIETDDFRNICGQGKFPLITTIKTSLNAPGVSAEAYAETQGPWRPSTVNWFDPNSSSTVTTAAPVTTTTKATTTAPPVTTTTKATTAAPITTTTRATTAAPVTTTTKATTAAPVTTTTAASGTFTCKSSGYFRDPSICSVFYYCQSSGGGSFTSIRKECPSGLVYDTALGVCNYPYNVAC